MRYQQSQIPFAILYRSLRESIDHYLSINLENDRRSAKESRRIFIRVRDHYGRPTFRAVSHLLWIVANSELSAKGPQQGVGSFARRIWRHIYVTYAENKQYRKLISIIEQRLDKETQLHMHDRLPQLSKKQKDILHQYIRYLNSSIDAQGDFDPIGKKPEKTLQKTLKLVDPACAKLPIKDACHWMLLLESEGVKRRDLKAFDKWLVEDKRNKAAFDAIEHAWLNLSSVVS